MHLTFTSLEHLKFEKKLKKGSWIWRSKLHSTRDTNKSKGRRRSLVWLINKKWAMESVISKLKKLSKT